MAKLKPLYLKIAELARRIGETPLLDVVRSTGLSSWVGKSSLYAFAWESLVEIKRRNLINVECGGYVRNCFEPNDFVP